MRLETYQPANEEGEPPPARRLTFAQKPAVQGALLSLDIASGDVLALVGGYDFADSEFDRAVQAAASRAPRSSRSSTRRALGRGYTPASIVHDRPVYIETAPARRRPAELLAEFHGPITMRKALAHSVNNATLHLDEIGIGT